MADLSPALPSKQARLTLLEGCAAAARAGVDYLLLRERQLEAGALLRLTQEVIEVCRGGGRQGPKILVARRPDVALAGGADGVHLTGAAGELSAAQVRQVFAAAVISRSCHTPGEVCAAAGEGVDVILFGPVFGKVVEGVEVVAPVGLQMLAQACAAAGSVPVLALGGVTQASAAACVTAGAAGVASIRMYFGAAVG